MGTYRYGNGAHAVSGISNSVAAYSPPDITLENTSYNRVLSLTQQGSSTKKVEFQYGADKQRRKSVYYENSVLLKTTIYINNYEKEIVGGTNIKEYDYIYTPEGLSAIAVKTGGSRSLYYVHIDHLGSIRLLTTEAKGIQSRYYYDAWGKQTLVSGSGITNRGYTSQEHLYEFGLINLNARLYDPLLGRFLEMDPYVQALDNTQSHNRYSYCLNNPLIYVDETGEFITWGFGKRGFSIGLNFGFFGFGISVGWSGGGSVGVYGELGPRVGGTGFGTGATVGQGINFGFRSGSFSTTSNAAAYASLGLFNVGVNVSYSYGKNGGWNWGISAGINLFGNDEWGLGLNVGYGSGGLDFGIGGYYNPNAWKDNPVYDPDEWNEANKIDYNNCYSYALDDIDNGNFYGLQPGDAGDHPITSYSDINLDYIVQASISDGRIKQPNLWNKLGFGKNGYYEVYLVIDQGNDYHWYRQDKGGNWSHKPGVTPVINIDASGRVMSNPVRANHNYGYINYKDGARKLWVKR